MNKRPKRLRKRRIHQKSYKTITVNYQPIRTQEPEYFLGDALKNLLRYKDYYASVNIEDGVLRGTLEGVENIFY